MLEILFPNSFLYSHLVNEVEDYTTDEDWIDELICWIDNLISIQSIKTIVDVTFWYTLFKVAEKPQNPNL